MIYKITIKCNKDNADYLMEMLSDCDCLDYEINEVYESEVM